MENTNTIYNIAINDLNGSPINFEDYKGKYILFVNVASKCGFTPQYKDLQKLQDAFEDKLVVIGVPCNQFGNQEPGTASEIQLFCDINYSIKFTLTEKINVKGSERHKLYEWLTQKKINGVKSSSVKWNFQKYLISPNGELIDYYYSLTGPLSSKITKHIK